MTSKRTDFASAKIGPGPGQYDYKSSIVVSGDNSVSSADKRRPELKIARFTEKIVQDEERRVCILYKDGLVFLYKDFIFDTNLHKCT